jgi:hypothetical protein
MVICIDDGTECTMVCRLEQSRDKINDELVTIQVVQQASDNNQNYSRDLVSMYFGPVSRYTLQVGLTPTYQNNAM